MGAVNYKERKVNLKSIMGVMSFGIPEGAAVILEVNEPDEQAALQTLLNTFDNLD